MGSVMPDVMRWFGGAIGATLLLLGPAFGQAASPTRIFESPQYRYTVALPEGCRHDEGPGTIDAVCSPELDAEKSAAASAAASLVLEVGVEAFPQDAGKAPDALDQGYGEAAFKDELAEGICGEADKTRVKIANVARVLEANRVVYTAEVACPEIKFLGLGERKALARTLVTPGLRYRLMARALKDDFEQNKPAIDSFLASFRVLPADK